MLTAMERLNPYSYGMKIECTGTGTYRECNKRLNPYSYGMKIECKGCLRNYSRPFGWVLILILME